MTKEKNNEISHDKNIYIDLSSLSSLITVQ